MRFTLSYDDMNPIDKRAIPLSDDVLIRYLTSIMSSFIEIYKSNFKNLEDYNILASVGPTQYDDMNASLVIKTKDGKVKSMYSRSIMPNIFDIEDFTKSIENLLSEVVS